MIFLLLVCIVCQKREAEGTNPVCLFKSGPGKSNFHTDYISIDHYNFLLNKKNISKALNVDETM